jgi:hypothetical protein
MHSGPLPSTMSGSSFVYGTDEASGSYGSYGGGPSPLKMPLRRATYNG